MVSQPKAPDPYDTAAAQEKSERTASQTSNIMNNANESNPYGNVNYSVGGYETVIDSKGKKQQVPRYNRTVTLSPEQQQLYNLQTKMQGNIGNIGVEQSEKLRGLLNTPFSTAGMQDWGATPGAQEVRRDEGVTDRRGVENAMMKLYDTDAAKTNAAQEAQMAARGLNPGSQGYGTMQQGQTDARNKQQLQAYLASGNESRAAQDAYNQASQQRFGQDMDISGYQNQLRQGQFGEQAALRNQQINELTALMSGSQVSMPEFAPMSRQGVSAAPVGNYIQDNYRQKAANANATNQGLFGLGGALLGGIGGSSWFGNSAFGKALGG